MDKPAVTPSAGYRALVVDDEVPLGLRPAEWCTSRTWSAVPACR